MTGELISVIIPAYNAGNYISECLNATLLQTYKNYEVIIVDDGSTDDTVERCKVYASRDERVKIIQNSKNSGVSVSRNRGIRAAKGEYIVFFDADDYPEIDLLSNYMSAIYQWKGSNVALILCGMYHDNLVNTRVANKVCILEDCYGYMRGENYKLHRASASTLAWLRLFNFVTNKIYERSVIVDNHIRFDEQMHIGEDLKFNLDYLDASAGVFGMINKPLYHYVKRTKSSLSISYYDQGIEDTKYIYKRLISWIDALEESTEDNVMVIKAIFITDWTARLTALYQENRRGDNWRSAKKKLQKEMQSKEFQKYLLEVRKSRKISFLRFLSLRTNIFGVFYFMRGIYQLMKG